MNQVYKKGRRQLLMRKRKQKLRKSIRTFYIVLAISIIAFCSAIIFNKTVKKDTYDKKEIILTYTNKLNTTYDVDLKDNKFMDQKTLPMGKTYVTNLIDKINEVQIKGNVVGIVGTYNPDIVTSINYIQKICKIFCIFIEIFEKSSIFDMLE